MNDYKTYLDNFVADLYKRIDNEDQKREEFNAIKSDYVQISKQLKELTNSINNDTKTVPVDFITNAQFINLMGISQKTAQSWRDSGLVGFSQIGNKIYIPISDIQKLINENYRNNLKNQKT